MQEIIKAAPELAEIDRRLQTLPRRGLLAALASPIGSKAS